MAEEFGHSWAEDDMAREVERRLLALGGAPLRHAVMARRRQGARTEPAFAGSLRLEGDQRAHGGAGGGGGQGGLVDVKTFHVLQRQVDPATRCVLPDIAQNIRELQRDAKLNRIVFGARFVADDGGGQKSRAG